MVSAFVACVVGVVGSADTTVKKGRQQEKERVEGRKWKEEETSWAVRCMSLKFRKSILKKKRN